MKPKPRGGTVACTEDRAAFSRRLKRMEETSTRIGKLSLGKTTVPGKRGERK